jgi:hypothetical protein
MPLWAVVYRGVDGVCCNHMRAQERGGGQIGRIVLCAVGWLALGLEPVAARYEVYHHYIGDEPWPLVAVDGVVAVQHTVGDTQRARSRVLQALPGWRSRSLWISPGASAESETFTLFAHPEASAEMVGFSGVDEGGPPASEILGQLDSVIDGEYFLTPLLVDYWDFTNHVVCAGMLLRNQISVSFWPEVEEDERHRVIEEIGGEILIYYELSFAHLYRLRILGARTGLEVLDLENALGMHPLIWWADPLFALETVYDSGCGGGGGGGGTGGSGTGGGGPTEPEPIPTLGSFAILALAALLVLVGVSLARQDPGV